MKKTRIAPKALTLADLQIVKGSALLPPGPIVIKNDWTRTGYGEDSVLGYDPRDCD